MHKCGWLGALCLWMGLSAGVASAQPRHDQPMLLQPDEIAVGIREGRLQTWRVAAPHREMAYRIRLWQPPGKAPDGGWPVVYLLDGDAAFESLLTTSERLPSARVPQAVLVGVGYDSPTRFAGEARAFDYTPPVPGAETPTGSPRNPQAGSRQRPGGGAGLFAEVLLRRIKPQVEQRADIDLTRQAVWGHSYGGLAVLYLLERHPSAFQRFVAVTPSLWWNGQGFAQRLIHGAAPTVPSGTTLSWVDSGQGGASAGPNLGLQVKQALAAWPGLSVEEVEFPGASHGQMYPNGLAAGLAAYVR